MAESLPLCTAILGFSWARRWYLPCLSAFCNTTLVLGARIFQYMAAVGQLATATFLSAGIRIATGCHLHGIGWSVVCFS
jgi:hypothetical protein